MTAITAPISTTTDATLVERTSPLWRIGLRAGVLAAMATTAVAGAALGLDVPLEVKGEQIPLGGFAQLTIMCTAIGVVLAKTLTRWASEPRHTFVVTTVVLTIISCVPDFVVDATPATKAVLVATHLVAAAIVIPMVAAHLPARTR
jgi:hypothetical protein